MDMITRRITRSGFADRLGLSDDTLTPHPCSAIVEIRENFDNASGVTIGQRSRSLCPITGEWDDEFIIIVPVLEEADGHATVFV